MNEKNFFRAACGSALRVLAYWRKAWVWSLATHKTRPWCHTSVTPVLERCEQEHQELKVFLRYTVSWRPVGPCPSSEKSKRILFCKGFLFLSLFTRQQKTTFLTILGQFNLLSERDPTLFKLIIFSLLITYDILWKVMICPFPITSHFGDGVLQVNIRHDWNITH